MDKFDKNLPQGKTPKPLSKSVVFLAIAATLTGCYAENPKPENDLPAIGETAKIDQEQTQPDAPADKLKMDQEFRDAAILGDFDHVRSTLAAHPDLVHQTDRFGFTALHEVVGEHYQEMAELLIEAGADVNAQNEDGIAPLHLAAYDFMAEVLLENGAEINLKSNAGSTPLHEIAENSDGLDVMQTLLEKGADVNAVSHNGDTALDIAIAREETEKVELLQRYKAKAKQ